MVKSAWYELYLLIYITLRYSTNRRRNATKCSARLIFPGTTSWRMSSGNTDDNNVSIAFVNYTVILPGLAIIRPSSRACPASIKPMSLNIISITSLYNKYT